MTEVTVEIRAAIAKLARGDEQHNTARGDIIARAATLKVADLIPDNWRADGTLKDTTGVWSTDEQRETYNDLYQGLSAAVSDAVGDDWYCWVQDFTDTEVIYYCHGDLWSASWTIETDGPITIGEATKVRPVTTYVGAEAARSAPPAALEWRRAKVASMAKTMEHRTFATSDVQIRQVDADTLQLTGYASVYETAYDMGWYSERIARGSAKRTLGESPDVQLLVNHTGLPLARTVSGTLRLSEDQRGLYVEADLDAGDPDVKSLVRKMARGDIDQMSFAFRATDDAWNDTMTERVIKAFSIHRGDVSVVNQGANPATSASVRSMDALGEVVGALEARAGKTFSAASMEALTGVLKRIATADEQLDEAQPLLADLIGVPNPDEPEPEDEPADETARSADVDALIRAKQLLFELRRAS